MKKTAQSTINKMLDAFFKKISAAVPTHAILLKNKTSRNIVQKKIFVKIDQEFSKSHLSEHEKHNKSIFAKAIVKRGLYMYPSWSPATKKTLVNNLLKTGFLTSQSGKKKGRTVPSFIVISPTYRCNVEPACVGCRSSMHAKKKDEEMSFNLIDKFVTDAEKDWNINFFVISGGEPFVREDMLHLYKKHPDSVFLVYTNGTLLTGSMAKRLAAFGNVLPAITLEDVENLGETSQIMHDLRKAGVAFGFSVTATPNNHEMIAGENFFRQMMRLGCSFGWFFICGPYGHNQVTDIMLTPKQRRTCGNNIRMIREKYAFPVADLWNDNPSGHDCMAGGTKYFHVNAYGDIEPCVFAQFSAGKLQDVYSTGKGIAGIMDLPLFEAIRRSQENIENPLRPCVIIDNPEVLRTAVKRTDTRSSTASADTFMKNRISSFLEEYAEGTGDKINKKVRKYI